MNPLFNKLTFEVDGNYWRVYFGDPLEGGVELGSIIARLVLEDPQLKEAFMRLFMDAVAGMAERLVRRESTSGSQTC